MMDNFRLLKTLKLQSFILFILSLGTFVIPLIYSIFVEDGLYMGYLTPIFLTFSIYIIFRILNTNYFYKLFRLKKQNNIPFPNNKDALYISVSVWFIFPLFVALCYVLTGSIDDFISAYFEAVSGFTTTGASILTDIEALPKSVLLLRDLTNWIGGLGFAIFVISFSSIAPSVSKTLIKFEAPKVIEEGIAPKVKQITVIIFSVYLTLSLIETILLLISGLDLYDAVNFTFSTIATGGFAPKNASAGAFDNPLAEIIISVFMIFGAINLQLYYKVYKEKSIFKFFKDEEVRLYLLIILFSVLISAFILYYNNYYNSFLESLRYALFQIVSAATTTGFSTTDYEGWHPFILSLIMILALIGAVGGSTGGGIKIFRVIFIYRAIYGEIRKLFHERMIYKIQLKGKTLDNSIINAFWTFLSLYIISLILFGMILTLNGHDIITSFSASVACITSLGPGLGDVGPADNFSCFNDFEKLLLSFEMIFGRLEIIPVIALLFLKDV
jgi:trk system potassium uptake protein TrkH